MNNKINYTLMKRLLSLAVKVGLFCFLYPYIAKFVLAFINAAASVFGGPFGV